MTPDLHWLTLTLAATALFWLPYVLNRMLVRGLIGTMVNPAPGDTPLAAWAQRAQRAQTNAVENLVVFAPAVLVVHILDRQNALTAIACELYFFSRLIHYIVYTAGIPVVRTLAFFGGWAGIAILLGRLLELL
jgi:uncharacterized MAPEG superfamily protein